MFDLMINKMLFFPRPNSEFYSKKWKSSEVAISINGQQLQGWFVKVPGFENNPLIIYYGGNAEDISFQLEEIKADGKISYFLMNYRGFGQSTGLPSEKDLFSDSLKLYDHLLSTYKLNPGKVCLVGRSIGSSIAAYVASKRKVKKLVLVTPFDELTSLIPKMVQLAPIKKIIQQMFTTTKYLENFKERFLVLWAEDDEIIPKTCLLNLVEKFHEQMILISIEGAHHQNISDFPDYYHGIEAYIHSAP